MKMILTRDTHGKVKPQGFEIGHMFHLNGKQGGDQLIYRFSKAKRTDTGEHGHGSAFAGATYAPVKHCPFCGDIL